MTGVLSAIASSGGIRVTVTPESVSGFGTGTVTTNQALSAVVDGGVAPLQYAWSLTGDPEIFALNAVSSFTFFRRDNVVSAETYSATATVVVTDAVGQIGSADGSVEIVGIDV